MQFPMHITAVMSVVSEASFVVFGKCHCSRKMDILHPEKNFLHILREDMCNVADLSFMKTIFSFSRDVSPGKPNCNFITI